MTDAQINQINLEMRSQPWYQQWFTQKGLNPNQVKLTDDQRGELAVLASQNGIKIAGDMKIDPAGNLNEKGGWAGLPTWAKIAIAAAPVAATAGFGLAGVGPMSGMFGAAEAAPGLAASVGAPAALESSIFSTAGLAGAGSTAAAGGSTISKLLGSTEKLADAGTVLGAMGSSEQANRYKKADMTQNYDRLMLQAAENRRHDESDAMKKLAQTGYIGSGGAKFTPPTIQLNGQQRTAPNFSFAPRDPSEAQKTGAATLESQMLERLKPGGSYTPTELSSYADRQPAEQIGTWGGRILSGAGAIKDIFSPSNYPYGTPPIVAPSGGPSIGKRIWDFIF